ncbi:hypothetical protein KIPB_002677 [Kipferlia bialata]|uniref:adenylate cyclase n=1 Tax=Kipferlia bialata TaxID=797122 RepID=A0A9K3CST7_9EUKA|nr:hypothetical protein KIPB_002677 [Kipferlia bialata]|eukprot:g2677.t1
MPITPSTTDAPLTLSPIAVIIIVILSMRLFGFARLVWMYGVSPTVIDYAMALADVTAIAVDVYIFMHIKADGIPKPSGNAKPPSKKDKTRHRIFRRHPKTTPIEPIPDPPSLSKQGTATTVLSLRVPDLPTPHSLDPDQGSPRTRQMRRGHTAKSTNAFIKGFRSRRPLFLTSVMSLVLVITHWGIAYLCKVAATASYKTYLFSETCCSFVLMAFLSEAAGGRFRVRVREEKRQRTVTVQDKLSRQGNSTARAIAAIEAAVVVDKRRRFHTVYIPVLVMTMYLCLVWHYGLLAVTHATNPVTEAITSWNSVIGVVVEMILSPPAVAIYVMIGMYTIVSAMWLSSAQAEDLLDSQAEQMHGAIQTALGIFTSALPKRTRDYVIHPRRHRKQGTVSVAAEILQSTLDTEREGDEGSPSDGGETCPFDTPRTHEEGAPGMIGTDPMAVIAFVGVTTEIDLPAVEYIRDIALLFGAIDGVIAAFSPSVEKVKSADGFLIVRSGERLESEIKERGDTARERAKEKLAANCKAMCQFCLMANATVSYCRKQGFPLRTIESLRAGIACGSVTGGVLGSQELMYDVFGDTVNTAARLMNKARPWQAMVTEAVAEVAFPACIPSGRWTQRGGRPAPHDRSVCRLPLLVSPTSPLYLKGKGMCPIRKVTVAPEGVSACMPALDAILRDDDTPRPQEAPTKTESGHLQTATDTTTVSEEQVNTLDSILHAPWEVIRARFDGGENSTSNVSLAKSISRTMQSVSSSHESAPFIGVLNNKSGNMSPQMSMPVSVYPRGVLSHYHSRGTYTSQRSARSSARGSSACSPEVLPGTICVHGGAWKAERGCDSARVAEPDMLPVSRSHTFDPLARAGRDRVPGDGGLATVLDSEVCGTVSGHSGAGASAGPSVLSLSESSSTSDGESESESESGKAWNPFSKPRVPGAVSPEHGDTTFQLADAMVEDSLSVSGYSQEDSPESDRPWGGSQLTKHPTSETASCVPALGLLPPAPGECRPSLSSARLSNREQKNHILQSLLASIMTPRPGTPAKEDTPPVSVPETAREHTESSFTSTDLDFPMMTLREVDTNHEALSRAVFYLDGLLVDDLQSLQGSLGEGTPLRQLAAMHRQHSSKAQKRDRRGSHSAAKEQKPPGLRLLFKAGIQCIWDIPQSKVRHNLFAVFLDISSLKTRIFPITAFLVVMAVVAMMAATCSILTNESGGAFHYELSFLTIACFIRLALCLAIHRLGMTAFERVIKRTMEGAITQPGTNTIRQALAPYHRCMDLFVLTGHLVTVLSSVALVTAASMIKVAQYSGSGAGTISDLLPNVWNVVLIMIMDSMVALMSMPLHQSVLAQFLRYVVYQCLGIYGGTLFPRGNYITCGAPLCAMFAVLQGIMQVVSMHVGVTFIVEIVATKVLVSRVASGRFMSPLTPTLARTSQFFAPMRHKDAVRVMRILEDNHVSTAIEGTILLSLFHDQIKELANSDNKSRSSTRVKLSHPEAVRYVARIIDTVYHPDGPVAATPAPSQAPMGTIASPVGITTPPSFPLPNQNPAVIDLEAGVPASLAPPPTKVWKTPRLQGGIADEETPEADTDTVAEGDTAITLFATEAERALMGEGKIIYYPLMLYTKLDIARFTSYCTEHGGQVVQVLSVIFTAFDRLVAKYEAVGIVKVKTVGDAYEVMRPFTAQELAGCSLLDITRIVALTVQASHELSQCAKRVFDALQVPMDIRCGVAMGPGFAALLGRFRVAHEIFGMASTHARLMESLAPLNGVAVCSHIYQLLRSSQKMRISFFSFGDVVRATVEPDTENKYECKPESEGDSDEDGPAALYRDAFRAYSQCVGASDAPAFVTMFKTLAVLSRTNTTPTPRSPVPKTSRPTPVSPQQHIHIREGYADDRGVEGVVLLGIVK